MRPESVNDDALLESLADGVAVDWAALDAAATSGDERRRYGNLRLVARVAELHRTLVLEEEAAPAHRGRADGAAPAVDRDRWGHLSIRARLASGAFGQVFRAHDPQLSRDVALKLLRGDISAFRPVERLLAEARTLAQVRHPNVVIVYGADVRDGAAGLWMELVDGQTLEAWLRTHGALGSGEATALGIDLCRALAAVHGAGLVHGDIKAQNVMREQRGRIVLMDFGAGRAQGADAAGVTGTPMYLAPEVLAGEPPTPQSDLYSLGVLLFHLLTDAYPFSGADLAGLRAAHADGRRTWLRDLRPDLPDALVRTIERAIDPDPARRFRTAGEMERALATALQPPAAAVVVKRAVPVSWRRWGFALGALALVCVVVGLIVWSRGAGSAPVVPAIRSIAVLPMKDLSDPTGLPYLADGLHDQLVTTLGQIQALRVTPRTSVMRFKDSTAPAGEIAKTLGVDAVLESTVSSTQGGADGSAARVKVNASLMIAGASTPIWSKSFDGRLGELPELEAKMARAIAATVRASITPGELTRLERPHQTSPAAEAAYFQGRMQLEGYGAAAARRAIDAFERVLSLDGDHPGAHVGAAYAYMSLAANGGTTHQKARAVAFDHVRRALELRDDLAEAHAAMGDIEFRYEWKIKAAEAQYQKALDLNSSLARARNEYAQLLAASGRFDESLEQARLSEVLDPGAVPTLSGLLLYYKRDYQAAEKAVREPLIGRPDVVGLHILLGRIAEARGHLAEAVEETRTALQLSANGGVPLRVQAVRLEALSGRPDEARRLLRELQREASQRSLELASRDLGYIRLAFGDHEGALQDFARALDERDPSLVWLGVDPRVDSLRQDVRFIAMLKQLGLN
jgi:TolB-like protein/tetratricopeptide (TPR) repeat protein